MLPLSPVLVQFCSMSRPLASIRTSDPRIPPLFYLIWAECQKQKNFRNRLYYGTFFRYSSLFQKIHIQIQKKESKRWKGSASKHLVSHLIVKVSIRLYKIHKGVQQFAIRFVPNIFDFSEVVSCRQVIVMMQHIVIYRSFLSLSHVR